MRFMVFMIPDPKAYEAGAMPTDEAIAGMMKYNEDLAKSGILLGADGLAPSARGARIKFSGGKSTVIDGPFTETKEIIGGYWIWQCKSKAEAIEWARRCPDDQNCTIELRQIYEMSDFGPAVEVQEAARVETISKAMDANKQPGKA